MKSSSPSTVGCESGIVGAGGVGDGDRVGSTTRALGRGARRREAVTGAVSGAGGDNTGGAGAGAGGGRVGAATGKVAGAVATLGGRRFTVSATSAPAPPTATASATAARTARLARRAGSTDAAAC